MSVTKKGIGWEIRNSIWLLWSFTLILNCVGFFWIGARTGKRKWIVSGFLYFLVDFALLIAAPSIEKVSATLNWITVALMIIGWSAAILQSFLSRKEYLLRREAVLDLQNATKDAYRTEIRNEVFGGNAPQSVAPSVQPRPAQSMAQHAPQAAYHQPQQSAPDKGAVGVQSSPVGMLDLNLAAEQQLAALPGVGVALAKRAVDLRKQTGGFVSVDDFCARLRLMPHFVEQIRVRAFASPPAPQTSPLEPQAAQPSPQSKSADGARVVDI